MGDKKGMGGMTFTRQIPDFLAKMQQGDSSGIEGALRKRRERLGGDDDDLPDRPEAEDEAPLMVDAADALTAKERRKLEAPAARVTVRGGSLTFKGDGSSAADRFRASAYDAEVAAEQAAAAAAAAAEAEAAAAGGKLVFKKREHGAVEAAEGKRKQKQKLPGGGAPAAKAVKNRSLLSFDDE